MRTPRPRTCRVPLGKRPRRAGAQWSGVRLVDHYARHEANSWGNSTLASSVQGWQAVALLQAMLEAVPNVPAGVTFTLSRNSRNRSQICWTRIHPYAAVEITRRPTGNLSLTKGNGGRWTRRSTGSTLLSALEHRGRLWGRQCLITWRSWFGTRGQISTTLMNGRNVADCLLHG